MIQKGQKRKHPPEDMEVSDRSSPTWENQRQFVFSVSLNKYQRSQELPEPSLRRSVLIANTLRQISLEACAAPSEGWDVSQPPCSSSSTLHATEGESIPTGAKHCSAVTADNSHTALAAFPNCAANRSPTSCHFSESNVPMTAEDEDWGSMSTEADFSLSAAISSILTALDSAIDTIPQATPRTPLRSLENLSAPSEGGVVWGKQGVRGQGVIWEQQGEGRVRESSMEAMRPVYLSDVTVEDLFQDIDTSLLEREMGVLGLRSGGYPAGDDLLRYLPPFSLSLNPNLKCLPSFSSFSPLSSSSPASASFSSQSQVREGFELDHLMEILVES
ncbi:SERTA domain-containing protein 3 isoform 1-T2 [Odontesthes bonariensis]|uniref:SERTA domain-containing protein 3 n=1 Tax=Odontesthes bonariensis TaxID=219752 RepID=UPI003F58E620